VSQILGISLGLFFPLSLVFPNVGPVILIFTAVLAFVRSWTSPFKITVSQPFPILSLTLMWIFLSTSWSITPYMSLISGLNVLAFMGAGLYVFFLMRTLPEKELVFIRKCWLGGGIIGCFVLGGVLLWDASFPIPKQGYDDLRSSFYPSVVLFTFMLGPLVYNLILYLQDVSYFKSCRWPRYLAGVSAFGAGGLLIHRFHMPTASFAFMVGGVGGICASFKPRFLIRLTSLLIVLFSLTSPFTLKNIPHYAKTQKSDLYQTLTTRFGRQLPLWEHVAKQIHKRPLLGWGHNTVQADDFENHIYEFEAPAHQMQREKAYQGILAAPLNVALQIWFELGLFGAFLFSLFLIWLGWCMVSMTDTLKIMASFYGFLTVIIFALNGFNIWGRWWIASIWWVVLIFGSLNCHNREKKYNE